VAFARPLDTTVFIDIAGLFDKAAPDERTAYLEALFTPAADGMIRFAIDDKPMDAQHCLASLVAVGHLSMTVLEISQENVRLRRTTWVTCQRPGSS
jgi:hypothetical protein